MRAERMKEVLDMVKDGTLPLRDPDMAAAMALLCELQKDSVELNYDKKTGELKTIKVKSYDMTTEEAAKSAVAGLFETLNEHQEASK